MAQAQLPDGASLAYDDYDFTAPWRRAETIVLVHGFSKNRKMWYDWLPELTAHYRVIRVDLRGHGDSSAVPAGFQMGLRPFSQDLDWFLDAIGRPAAHFVMAEFASAVALDFATTFPRRLQSLVMPGFGYNWRNSAVSKPEWVRLCEEEGSEAWARATNKYRLPADADPAMREWYIQEQARVPAALLAAVFRYNQTLDQSAILPQVTTPSLVIAGSEGRQGTLEHTLIGVRQMPNCRLAVLDGMPFNVMSAAPERCVAETLRFLDDLRAGRPIKGA